MEKAILREEHVQLPRRVSLNRKRLHAQNATVPNREYQQTDAKKTQEISGWEMTRILTGWKAAKA